MVPPCECFGKLAFLAYVGGFFANFATVKNFFSKTVTARMILVLGATFVPNLTFLSLLSPEILFGEKEVAQSPTQKPSFRHR